MIVADLQTLIDAPDLIGRLRTQRRFRIETHGAVDVFADESNRTIGEGEVGSLRVLATKRPPWQWLLSGEDRTPGIHAEHCAAVNRFASGSVRFVDLHLLDHAVDSEELTGPDGCVTALDVASFAQQQRIAHSVRDILRFDMAVAREQTTIEKAGWTESILAIRERAGANVIGCCDRNGDLQSVFVVVFRDVQFSLIV